MTPKNKDDIKFMSEAIKKAMEGIRKGQTPFGACIVKDGKTLSLAHNSVWENTDITSHAEMQAIRQACRKTKHVSLTGSVIYSTCEPCPMCFSAIHWAGISKIVYGAKIADAKKAGFRELTISNNEMKKKGKSPVNLAGGVLEKECRQLFKTWAKRKGKKTY